MNPSLAQFLNQLNVQFYRENAASFSSTRSSAWEGWRRLLEVWQCSLGKGFSETLGKEVSEQASDTLSVLDVACGNRRFEQFLAEQMPDQRFSVVGVDSCEELLPDDSQGIESSTIEQLFLKADLVSGLLEGNGGATLINCNTLPGLLAPLPKDKFDLVVSFGFMHHIPGAEHRLAFLESLAAQCASGGLFAVSFWRFMTNEQLAKKAVKTTQEACEFHALEGLEPSDYLLGWSDTSHSYRYCHSFEQEEIDQIINQVCASKPAGVMGKISFVDRFVADGRTHDLNEYVVFRVG